MSRFVPDHSFEKAIRAQPDYQRGMASRARRLLPFVQAATPRATGYAVRRLAAIDDKVVARDPFWHLIEFGSANNTTYAPMRNGVKAAGLRYVDALASA